MSDYADGIWQCLYCNFWDVQDRRGGNCRRYPPSYIDQIEMRRYWYDSEDDADEPHAHWPMVAHYEWCGEFKRCDRQEAIRRLEFIVEEENEPDLVDLLEPKESLIGPLYRKVELREIREEEDQIRGIMKS